MPTNKELANALRALSLDMVKSADSGHPGLPLGFADVMMILFKDFLQFNPLDPTWPIRDRLILSAGHGSALLYAALFLSGYNYSIDDLKNFRKLHSKTPGHPEYNPLLGIETTTGPLGQGLANAVGMAISAKITQAKLNDFQHKVYAIVGDGCLMEGISYEATSLAGHLQLDNLIVIFDSNNISIDGPISLTSSENMRQRFEAINWLVLEIDGHDYDSIYQNLIIANRASKPVIIIAKTIIGYGSSKHAGNASAHGSPFSDSEIETTKMNLSCLYNPFEIPQKIIQKWRSFHQRSLVDYEKWIKNNQYITEDISFNKLHDKFFIDLKNVITNKPEATRKTAGNVLEALIEADVKFIGGSADLTPSNCTKSEKQKTIGPNNFKGTYIHYGVREHAMAAIMNGIAAHGIFRPYGGTFLAFSDYCRPAIRLSALMKLPVFYIMTHDSIALGEDGPTHQPVEHLAALRAIPGLTVLRPADAVETIECFEIAMNKNDGPILIALSRQNLPLLRQTNSYENNHSQIGGYIIKESEHEHQLNIIATGSEVKLALEVADIMEQKKVGTKVISMPSLELFSQQSIEYQRSIIKDGVRNIIIEAASEGNWHKVMRDNHYTFYGMNTFCESGNIEDLYKKFGFVADKIVKDF